MKRIIAVAILSASYVALPFFVEATYNVPEKDPLPVTTWQSPREDLLKVLHASRLPRSWTSPTGKHLLLGDPVLYPPLAELSAPMHKLAGIRVNPVLNGYHGQYGYTSPQLVNVDNGTKLRLDLPAKSEVYTVKWTVDGQRFALIVGHSDHIGLWVGSVDGAIKKIKDLAINPLLGSPVSWLPNQEHLLVRRIPSRGPAPDPPSHTSRPKNH
ncbi:hypothetical protein H206_03542 [Candidatus Electrothrix aarhusensis]|uniref:Uncharacterized protein n=1 Tax=Candidatus Electrothrix aarhusensis TaxID=1859131 RepID=A0A444IRP7_9BACT|nr:hypothetical protein H206_03542 [Candidatus Electrothrix aarhusensis]